jgi:hypothetical protein
MGEIQLPAAVVHKSDFPYERGVPVLYDLTRTERLDTDACCGLVRAGIHTDVTLRYLPGSVVERKLRELRIIAFDPEALEDRLAGPRELRLLL